MPYAAPRYCSCGKIVPHGVKCECQAARDRARKAKHDASRPNARDRGYTTRWDKARAGFLAKHPMCRCGAKATIVDHIQPHRGDSNLFWMRNNWQPLCVRCHSSSKQSEEHRNASNPLAHPFIDKPPLCKVTIVCGAPGSGKADYVKAHAGKNDCIINLDSIKAKLARTALYAAPDDYTRPALDIRNKMLRQLGETRMFEHAWFITTEPDPAARASWCRKLNARIVTMPATLAECIATIEADPLRTHCKEKHIELAKAWFSKNTEALKATAKAFQRWRADNPRTPDQTRPYDHDPDDADTFEDDSDARVQVKVRRQRIAEISNAYTDISDAYVPLPDDA